MDQKLPIRPWNFCKTKEMEKQQFSKNPKIKKCYDYDHKGNINISNIKKQTIRECKKECISYGK